MVDFKKLRQKSKLKTIKERDKIIMSNGLVATTSEGNGEGRGYFVGAPTGIVNAVAVDVVDLGYKKNSWGKIQRKVQFVFQLETLIDEKLIKKAKKRKGLDTTITDKDMEIVGKPLLAFSKPMNLSLFAGGDNMSASDLFTFLSDWNGEDVGEREPLEPYVGKQATLMIKEVKDKKKSGVYYSNIVSIEPLEDEENAVEIDESYVRRHEREGYKAPPTLEDVEGGLSGADDSDEGDEDEFDYPTN